MLHCNLFSSPPSFFHPLFASLCLLVGWLLSSSLADFKILSLSVFKLFLYFTEASGSSIWGIQQQPEVLGT